MPIGTQKHPGPSKQARPSQLGENRSDRHIHGGTTAAPTQERYGTAQNSSSQAEGEADSVAPYRERNAASGNGGMREEGEGEQGQGSENPRLSQTV